MKYLNKVCLLIVVLLLIVTAAACASAAEAKKAVYENGDIITVVTPYSPGGSGDRAFRLVTPYLTKEIEAMTGAKVDFIVESVPGGGGVIGNTQIYKARPDGKTLGIIGLGAAPFLQLLQGGYDVEKYTYIAQLINSPAVLVVAGNSAT